MIPITQIEIHVVHSCNLACESCSHYSNLGHKGILPLETANDWLSGWSNRLEPEHFNLLGGEPSLHPQLPDFVRLARIHWPNSRLRLVSNGFFLHRHLDLPAALRETDTLLAISRHHSGPEYVEKFRPIEELALKWEREHGIQLQIWKADGRWTRRYLGPGQNMQPYEDGRPRDSWKICPAKHCQQIHLGKLWKCPALAYLGMQQAKYGLGEKWQPYLQYQPLEPGCSDEELRAFVARQEESVCGMCPAVPQPFMLPSPLPRVDGKRRVA